MAAGLLDPSPDTSLAAVLDTLTAVEPSSLGDRLLGQRCSELLVTTDRVAALLAATIAEAEQRGLCGTRVSPGGTTMTWVSDHASARLGRAETWRLVRRSATVAGLPLVALLHEGGEVSTAFLDAAAAGLRTLPDEAHASWDALLAGEARNIDPADIPTILAHLKVLVDPDEASAHADAAAGRSVLRMSPYGSDGAWAINGTLHGLEGELVARLIQHYAKPRGEDDHRSAPERQAAALVQICRIADRAAHDPDFVPAPRGTAGHVVVIARHDTWTGQPGSPAATTEQTVLDPGQTAALRCTTTPEVLLHGIAERVTGTDGNDCRTSDVAEQDANLLLDLLAGLIPPELGTVIEPLAHGRALRSASRTQWFALLTRDQHCVIPGCRREPLWCEAHHLREWLADGGRTDLSNLALVCWEHHTWLHRTHQRLHPPWCCCRHCHSSRAAGRYQPHEWHISELPPLIGDP